jgi:hypothetical protein
MSGRTGSTIHSDFSAHFGIASGQDEHWRNAAECKRMAGGSRNETDRESWLKMSESWLRMVRGTKRSAQERASDAFDAQQSKHGTGQDDSESSD